MFGWGRYVNSAGHTYPSAWVFFRPGGRARVVGESSLYKMSERKDSKSLTV